MKATYEPTKEGKRLNVRKAPYAASDIVTRVEAGTYDAESVERGWVKMEGGYADARYLTVTEGKSAVTVANADDETEDNPEKEPQADDDRDALKKMTNQQLYKLAEQSGIDVAKGSTKAELIDAILAGADD